MSGGKGGGGGYDAGPMIQYGNKALELQKQMYEEGKDYIQPYYTGGTSGLNELLYRLGLGGGQGSSGTKTAEQIRSEMLPQYTKKSSIGDKFITSDGRIVSLTGDKGTKFKIAYDHSSGPNSTPETKFMDQFVPASKYGDLNYLKKLGLTPYESSKDVIDYSGLNAAVQRQLDAQKAAQASAAIDPMYGSLLDTYSGQNLFDDPGYKFRLGEGQKATERALAASGKYLAPAGIKALQEYGQGMASQEYGNAYNRFTNDQTNIYNRLANIAGLGQTATGQQLGSGKDYAGAGTDLYTGMGNAITSANLANQQSKGSMFGSLLGLGGQLGAALIKSDPALKTDIVPMGIENGFNVYQFRYKDDPDYKTYIGVMADEVKEVRPDAVVEIDGYMAVDYSKIGVNFREVRDAT